MKHKAYWIVLVLVLAFASSCKKDDKRDGPCHDTITIYNGSADTVMLGARNIGQQNGLCVFLIPTIIPPNSGWSDKVYSGCWEEHFESGNVIQVERYIVEYGDPYEIQNLYECDSLDNYFTILQHNVLSLADLQAMDFVIRYE